MVRYDDREVIITNLIDSFRRLMDFGRKHLNDVFVLDGDQSVSARDKILRNVVDNKKVSDILNEKMSDILGDKLTGKEKVFLELLIKQLKEDKYVTTTVLSNITRIPPLSVVTLSQWIFTFFHFFLAYRCVMCYLYKGFGIF